MNQNNIIYTNQSIKECLKKINDNRGEAVIVIEKNKKVKGVITDGDIRRAIINGASNNESVLKFCNSDFKYIKNNESNVNEIISLRNDKIFIIPIVNDNMELVEILNLNLNKNILPLDVVIMAGGRGERLKPLTDNCPKPLLKVGNKPILEHNVSHLIKYGIKKFHISINYLGEMIIDFFNQTKFNLNVEINFINEKFPMGTIGALSKLKSIESDTILLINSDVLTTIEYDKFYLDFIKNKSDVSVAAIDYSVNIPYAIFDVKNENIHGFKEKPKLNFKASSGMYLIKKDLLKYIPKDKKFDATDFIKLIIDKNYKLSWFDLDNYWLDIGKHSDFIKAQKDIKKLHL